jgi:hypothetical protein
MKQQIVESKPRLITIALGLLFCGILIVQLSNAANDPKFKKEITDKCSSEKTYSGEIRRGEEIKIDIGNGLLFYLRASHDPVIEGWHIQIVPKDNLNHDYAWQLNPPYGGFNRTDISTSYGFSAKDAIAINPRVLKFPLNAEAAKRAEELVHVLLSTTGPDFDRAQEEMGNIPRGKAVFKIIKSKIGESGSANHNLGRIEWLQFELTITFPSDSTKQKNKK